MAIRQVFSDIADAIRDKDGTQNTYTPAQMAQAIQNIPAADNNFKKMVEGDPSVQLSDLTVEVVLPNDATKIRASCFKEAYFKKITIGENVTEIGKNSFYGCNAKDGVVFNNKITSIKDSAFYGMRCNSGTEITCPGSTSDYLSVESSIFRAMRGVSKITIGNAAYGIMTIYSQNYLFGLNANLIEAVVYVSGLAMYANSGFQDCTSLQKVSMIHSTNRNTSRNYIGSAFFKNCTNCLEYDFTGYKEVPGLVNVDAFTGINANAKIVVPDDLYDSWIAASNWATLSSYIVKESVYNA